MFQLKQFLKTPIALSLACLAITAPPAQASLEYASNIGSGFNPTDATQTIIDAFNYPVDTIVVDLQSSDWIVQPLVFNASSNIHGKVIIFEPGVVLKAKSNAFPNLADDLLELDRVQDVTLLGYGATFEMRRSEYTTGGNRHCINLIEAVNITIKGLTLTKSGGDGVYLGAGSPSGFCDGITVQDCVMRKNKRQGVSITTARNVLIKNCIMQDTHGALPSAGIDIEPNPSTGTPKLENIVISKCRFTQNAGAGIQIGLDNFSASQSVSITFEDCYLSENFNISGPNRRAEILVEDHSASQAGGFINFVRCVVNGTDVKGALIRKNYDAYPVTFQDCIFKEVSVDQTLGDNYPILLKKPGSGVNDPFGGIAFRDCMIIYDHDIPFLKATDVTSANICQDVSASFTIVNPNFPGYDVSPAQQVNVNIAIDGLPSLPNATVTVQSIDNWIDEGQTVTGQFEFERLQASAPWPLAIFYDMTGSATEGLDYSYLPGFVLMPVDEVKATEDLTALRDMVSENNEQVRLNLSPSSCYVVSSTKGDAQLRIRDQALSYKTSSIRLDKVAPITTSNILAVPNPVQQNIRISLDDNTDTIERIRLFDLNGKEVIVAGNINGPSIDLNMEHLAAGVYLLKVQTKQQSKEFKVVKP